MRRARLESTVENPDTVAAALVPDDTAEIETRVEDGRLVAEFERETTRGLQSTLDDYVVNLGVAIDVAGNRTDTQPADTNTHDT